MHKKYRRKFMRRPTKLTRLFAGPLTGLLFAICALPLSAQTASASHAASFGYDKAHEITVNGTIQDIVTKRVLGSPVGMHLIVAGSKGLVDAHLGPYLTKDTQEALHTGTPVQIVGAIETLHGKDVLLARQVIFGGRMVTIRGENGFLVREHNPRATRVKSENQTENTSRIGLNGGAR
jgi:hypothetical protein